MQRTKIPYLTHSWSPMHGCTPIAPGCENCWAEKMSKRQAHMGNYDPADPFGVVCDESKLDEPLKLRKPAVIGTAFMGDLFHKNVPFEFIDKVFAVMALAPQHTFLVFTKRPGRMAEYLLRANASYSVESVGWHRIKRPIELAGWPLPNVHLYTSISDQATADANVPHLLRCPAAVRGVSLEPMLGPVGDLQRVPTSPEECEHCARCGCEWWQADAHGNRPKGFGPCLDHVIVGCESGPGRRPCKLEWIEDIVEQCQAAGVPVYVKQIEIDGKVVSDVTKFPPHLQLRETPPRRANLKGE